jgi:hypothetical protein
VYEEVTNLLWSNYSCHSNKNNDTYVIFLFVFKQG